MQATCQCTAITFTIPFPAPIKLVHCHCTHCRRQSSSAFGTSAVFPSFPLPLSSQPIGMWPRETSTGAVMECYFCKVCGTRVAHAKRGHPTVNVKGGVIEGLDWRGAVHIYCGDKVVEMEIPEGVEAFVEGYGGEVYVPKA